MVWCAVLSISLLVAIGLAGYGFETASGASDSATRTARREAVVARHVAAVAAALAAQANSVSAAALARLQAETAGECYRVNYLRWQVDHADYAAWRRDYTTARYLARLTYRPIRVVARAFHQAARAWHFLPLTDCAAAASSPTTYRAPSAIPFNQVSPTVLHQVLRSPPQPPGG